VTLVHDPARVPTGHQVRRLTGQIQGAREGRGLGAVLQEVWYTAVTVGLSVLFVTGVARTIRAAVPDTDGPSLASSDLPALLVLLVVAGGVLSLAGRLGPVGVGGGGAAWWLPMPVDRRGLLRPAVLAWPAVAAGGGAILAPLLVTLFGAEVSLERVLGWAAVGGSAFALLAAAAAIAQAASRGGVTRRRSGGSHLVAVGGEVLMLVGTVSVAALALGSGSVASSLSTWRLGQWWVAAPLLLAAVGLTMLAERRTGRLSGAGLRAKGSIGDRARVAVLSLDMRELARALSIDPARVRHRSYRLPARGPRSAVVLADLVPLLRSPRPLLVVAVMALLAVAAARMSLLGSGLPLYATLVLTGFWAANAAAAGARHAEMAPVLDRLLPLSAREVRVVRGGVPLIGAVLWAAVVLGAQAWASGSVVWLGLLAPWSLVLAAAAVRSAYRPAPSWSSVPIATPMGGTPPSAGLFKGLDVALIGTLPTAVMLYVGALTPGLLLAQTVLALALVGVLIAASGRRPRRVR
jgi:hypothetical protein